jgi:hypothetical protein
VKLKFDVEGGRSVLMKAGELNSFDDREAKPQNIGLHIGRRPILAFGNSDGESRHDALQPWSGAARGSRCCCTMTTAGARSLTDRDFKLSPLVEALDKARDYGITVVSMRTPGQGVLMN